MHKKLLVAHLIAPAEDSVKRHLLYLLGGFDLERVRSVVICAPTSKYVREMARVGHKVVPLDISEKETRFRDFRAAYRLRNLLKSIKPNILHAHDARAGKIARLAVLGLWRRPAVVITMHKMCPDDGAKLVKRLAVSYTERFFYPFTSRMITVSEALKDRLCNELILSPIRMSVVRYSVGSPQVKRYIRTDPDRPRVVGTAAPLLRHTGVDDFIQAALVVVGQYPSSRFPIIGEGPFLEDLERMMSMLGLNENIEFIGYQENPLPIMVGFDVFVHSPPWSAGGLEMLEAMSLGIPVVATRAGVIPEIIDDSKTGLLAVPRNPYDIGGRVCQLLSDPGFAADIGEAGRKLVRSQYSARQMADAVQKVYLRCYR